jgi:hypothetical protein
MAITLDQVRRVVSHAVSGGIATIGGVKIDKYDGRISADAIEWLESYIDATNFKGWNDDQRFLNFNQVLFKNAKNWYRLYVKRATSPPTNWAELMEAFIDYHVPKDRANSLREEMVNKKQGRENVIQYITDKRLLCLEMNPNMPFNEMRSFIIDGMIPEIKTDFSYILDANEIVLRVSVSVATNLFLIFVFLFKKLSSNLLFRCDRPSILGLKWNEPNPCFFHEATKSVTNCNSKICTSSLISLIIK